MNKKIIITVAAIVIAVLFFAVANHGRSPKHNATPQKEAAPSQPAVASMQNTAPAPVRAIHASYRPLNFALLPGGFTSVDEFRQRVAKDPVLRSFYGDCADAQLSMQALPEDIFVFVTFRRGNEIKWTRKPMLVHIGEYVLNFCGKTVLARCGNVVSWNPMEPSENIPTSLLELPVDEFSAPEVLALTAQAAPVAASGSRPISSSISPIYIPWTGSPVYTPSGTAPTTPPVTAPTTPPVTAPTTPPVTAPTTPPVTDPTPPPGTDPTTPLPPNDPVPLEGDEFVGHQALFTLLVGLFVIGLLKLLTR